MSSKDEYPHRPPDHLNAQEMRVWQYRELLGALEAYVDTVTLVEVLAGAVASLLLEGAREMQG